MRQLELLAPARDANIGIAAIDCGADAVYIAGPQFGARQAAGNDIAEIRRLCDYAHKFGVRIFVTLNTILYDNELEAAYRQMLEVLSFEYFPLNSTKFLSYALMPIVAIISFDSLKAMKKFGLSVDNCNDIKDRTIFIRNRVIHGGYFPTKEEVERAIEDAKLIMKQYNVPLFID